MNSVEAYKGFITFIILAGIVTLSVVGFGLVNKSSNTETKAKLLHSEPENVSAEILNTNQAKISWRTKTPTITKIRYSKAPLSNESQTVNGPDGEHINHEIELNNLDKNNKYEFRIIQDGKEYPNGNEVYSFFVPDDNTTNQDVVAPFISEPNPEQSLSNQNPTTNEQIQIEEKEEDNSGFSEILEATPGQALGSQTNIIGESITKEFKEALLYQDLRYDFNTDSIVDTNDYPLFINFIMNQED